MIRTLARKAHSIILGVKSEGTSLLNLGAGDALHRSHPFLKEVWSNG